MMLDVDFIAIVKIGWLSIRQQTIYLVNWSVIQLMFIRQSVSQSTSDSGQNSRQNFSLQHQYNINLICDKNKEKYQFGDN